MDVRLHQTHHTIADFSALLAPLQAALAIPGLHLFPELYLTGYPLGDLCLQASFIRAYSESLKQLEAWCLSRPKKSDTVALVGALAYEMGEESGVPGHIRNVILEIKPGEKLREIYSKRLLPNYDIFDEQKYFTPGNKPGVWKWDGKTFALLICEDMWASSFHRMDPCDDLLKLAPPEGFSAVINLSASPYNVSKEKNRLARGRTLSHTFQAPFLYVNRVGGEDEVLFDGGSFVINADQVLARAPFFKSETLSLSLPERDADYLGSHETPEENTWESLFAPRFAPHKTQPAELRSWDDETCASVVEALQFGLREYAQKNGFTKFLVGLSGGMDSALVMTLARLADLEVEALYMPSIHSASLSWDLSHQLCQNLGTCLTSFPIKFLHSNVKLAFQNNFRDPFEGLADENVQSRLRGLALYTRSNQTGAMVINTSNKSELAVGYSTQYGDAVGALSLLGDLYKTEVYRLAQWFETTHPGLIPQGIIHRPPSAELRPEQTDEDSLPPYSRLDAILEGILSFRCDGPALSKMGFAPEEVARVFHLYAKAEYKRRQFCPILKIKAKSFGFGYRVPISKHTGFYTP